MLLNKRVPPRGTLWRSPERHADGSLLYYILALLIHDWIQPSYNGSKLGANHLLAADLPAYRNA